MPTVDMLGSVFRRELPRLSRQQRNVIVVPEDRQYVIAPRVLRDSQVHKKRQVRRGIAQFDADNIFPSFSL